jgi:hypothetical protein
MEENNDASSVMPSGFGILRRKEKDPKVTISHNIMPPLKNPACAAACSPTDQPSQTHSLLFFSFSEYYKARTQHQPR